MIKPLLNQEVVITKCRDLVPTEVPAELGQCVGKRHTHIKK